MKASEMIKKLQESIDKFGDTDVVMTYDCLSSTHNPNIFLQSTDDLFFHSCREDKKHICIIANTPML